MGVEITLLPFDRDHTDYNNSATSWTVLEVGKDPALRDLIDGLPLQPCPSEFWSHCGRTEHDDPGFGLTRETARGEPIQCATAIELARVFRAIEERYPDAVPDRHRATRAYLEALPAYTRVAIYLR